jgi:hypothetical protein
MYLKFKATVMVTDMYSLIGVVNFAHLAFTRSRMYLKFKATVINFAFTKKHLYMKVMFRMLACGLDFKNKNAGFFIFFLKKVTILHLWKVWPEVKGPI